MTILTTDTRNHGSGVHHLFVDNHGRPTGHVPLPFLFQRVHMKYTMYMRVTAVHREPGLTMGASTSAFGEPRVRREDAEELLEELVEEAEEDEAEQDAKGACKQWKYETDVMLAGVLFEALERGAIHFLEWRSCVEIPNHQG